MGIVTERLASTGSCGAAKFDSQRQLAKHVKDQGHGLKGRAQAAIQLAAKRNAQGAAPTAAQEAPPTAAQGAAPTAAQGAAPTTEPRGTGDSSEEGDLEDCQVVGVRRSGDQFEGSCGGQNMARTSAPMNQLQTQLILSFSVHRTFKSIT